MSREFTITGIIVLIIAVTMTIVLSKMKQVDVAPLPKSNLDSSYNAIIEKNKKSAIDLKNKRKEVYKKLHKEYDDIRQVSFYTDKSTSKYIDNSFYLYFVVDKNGEITPRIKIGYYNEDWLFIESFAIKTDNKIYNIYESTDDGVRDVVDGGVYESVDLVVDNGWLNIFEAISKSKSVKLRYNGQDYYKDRIIPKKERLALIRMYKYYKEIR